MAGPNEALEEFDNHNNANLKNIPEGMGMEKHGGHKLRTGKTVVDRSKIDQSQPVASGSTCTKKAPNAYSGHTYRNKTESYKLDGHKMIYHMDRVHAWQKGERIAPIHIDMGLTKFCNVGCVYCIGVTQGMVKGTMIQPEALLRFVEDAGRAGVRSVAFIGDGEPTLNPGLNDAIVLADKVGVDTGIATNGLLINMNRIHEMLRCATFVRINLSAASPESFKAIHQHQASDFNKLVEIMKTMTKIKRENNYKCTIGIQMVLIPENFDQVIPLAQLGADCRVDYLQIKQCSDTEYKEIGVDYSAYSRVQNELKIAETFSTSEYFVKVKWNKINIMDDTEVYKDGYRKYDICYGTPFLGQISGNGKVYPCGPYFGKDRFLMGDIHKESYFDIVQGDRYWAVHKDIQENVDVHCDCTVGCRQDYINKFLWDLKQTPNHVNFI